MMINNIEKVKEFYLLDDNIKLNAVLEMPDRIIKRTNEKSGVNHNLANDTDNAVKSILNNNDKIPIFIILHGFTGNKDEAHILVAAKALRKAGYATLRMDMYGHGKSEGEFKNHTLFKWISNTLVAVDYCKKLEFVSDIYLCGHSQGGLMAMLVAALEKDIVKGLIALAPACMIPEQARKGMLLGVQFDPECIPDAIHIWDDRVLDGNYIRVAQMINAEDAMDAYKGPVLIVHGSADETVPVKYGKMAADRYKNCKFVEIEDDTHCYDNHYENMADAVYKWAEV